MEAESPQRRAGILNREQGTGNDEWCGKVSEKVNARWGEDLERTAGS